MSPIEPTRAEPGEPLDGVHPSWHPRGCECAACQEHRDRVDRILAGLLDTLSHSTCPSCRDVAADAHALIRELDDRDHEGPPAEAEPDPAVVADQAEERVVGLMRRLEESVAEARAARQAARD